MSTPHSIDYKYLFEEAFRRWRILQLSNKYADNPALSLDAFADYLSFSQSAISQWMSGNRTPSNRSLEAVLPGLISLFGNDPIIDDLYEAIGIEPPDPLLLEITRHWSEINEESKYQIAQIIAPYASERKRRGDTDELRPATADQTP